MATGIQTGIRTGASAPLPTGKGPAGGGGLGKVLASWNSMSSKMKFVVMGVLAVLVIGGVTYVGVSAANKPVSLYSFALTQGDLGEIGQKLTQMGIAFTQEPGKILVAPSDKSRAVALLMNSGLPHWSVGQAAPEGAAFSPKTEKEKQQQYNRELEATLIDQLRNLDFVADARVNLAQPDEDSLERDKPKAAIYLKLKPNQLPNKMQVQAIVNLVAMSVPGLLPDQIRVLDTSGRVWNDGAKIAQFSGAPGGGSSSEDEAFGGDEHTVIQKSYEKLYRDKVKNALNPMLGSTNYTVEVNAEINFDQAKIETTQVGAPDGSGQVVTVSKKVEEKYNNNPDEPKKKPEAKPKSEGQQVGVPTDAAGKDGTDTNYQKVQIEQKVDSSKVAKTMVLATNVVKRLAVAVAVDGKLDDAKKNALTTFVANATGIDAGRGDTVSVTEWAFNRTEVTAAGPNPFDTPAPINQNSGPSKTLMLMAMLVPTTILLSILTIFLLKQRRVQADRQGLVMTMGPGATTSDISDLLSDKIGRSTATTQTTRVNNTEQLEKLAKEKPTKVAELLKSTWLSDRER